MTSMGFLVLEQINQKALVIVSLVTDDGFQCKIKFKGFLVTMQKFLNTLGNVLLYH